MIRRYGFRTLESRIYAIFTLMIFSAILIMQLVSFRFTINTVRRSMLRSGSAMLKELANQIDLYIAGMEQTFLVMVNDPAVQRYLEYSIAAGSGDHEASRLAAESGVLIQSKMQNYIQARNDIANILLSDINGRIISGNPENRINPWTEVKDKAWFTEALSSGGMTVVSQSYVQNLIEGKYSWVVSLSRSILSDGISAAGVLLIDLKFNRIMSSVSLVIGEKLQFHSGSE